MPVVKTVVQGIVRKALQYKHVVGASASAVDSEKVKRNVSAVGAVANRTLHGVVGVADTAVKDTVRLLGNFAHGLIDVVTLQSGKDNNRPNG